MDKEFKKSHDIKKKSANNNVWPEGPKRNGHKAYPVVFLDRQND